MVGLSFGGSGHGNSGWIELKFKLLKTFCTTLRLDLLLEECWAPPSRGFIDPAKIHLPEVVLPIIANEIAGEQIVVQLALDKGGTED